MMGNLPSSIGPYHVVRQLGEGGMGAVFEGVHAAIERRVAIKVLKPEYTHNPELVARFFNEARAVNRVEHPSLVQVSDFGKTPDGTVYLVMEYLRGGMLRTRLDKMHEASQRFPIEQLLQIAWQVAEALAATHARRIVHRDLKPENIMIVPDPAVSGGERAKILDFGIAKLHAASQVMTAPSRLMGTPRYMSPEQCRGASDIDGRTDVYALGILLYEMMAGQPPFGGDSLEGILAQHLFKSPDPVAPLAPQSPPALNELVHRMLAKEPLHRPMMTEVEATLRSILAQASPPGRAANLAPLVPETSVSPLAANLNTTLRHSLGQRIPSVRRWRWVGALLAIAVAGGVAALTWSHLDQPPPKPLAPGRTSPGLPVAPKPVPILEETPDSLPTPSSVTAEETKPAPPKPTAATPTSAEATPSKRSAPAAVKPIAAGVTSAPPKTVRPAQTPTQQLEKKPSKPAPVRRNMYDGIL